MKNHPDFHFNISHSGNALAAAFCERETGIDIERIKKPNFKVADRFFCETEKDYIKKSDDPELAFFRIWTAKEAYAKFTGRGIDADFKKTEVLGDFIRKRMITITTGDYVLSAYTDCVTDYKIIKFDENSEIFKS